MPMEQVRNKLGLRLHYMRFISYVLTGCTFNLQKPVFMHFFLNKLVYKNKILHYGKHNWLIIFFYKIGYRTYVEADVPTS